ncbi:MAG: hypothetical protein NTU94_11445 [Planctomycetota bacterium]|nr:hypothetical protein [Planctomycetota bacterium]
MRRSAARSLLALVAAVLAAGAVVGAAEGPATRPTTAARKPDLPPPAIRAIRGKLTPPERVKEAYLVERAMDLKIPVKVDPRTGAFEVAGLRLGTYDLVVVTPWGRLEGIDMDPKLSEYDALIPPEYRTEEIGKAAEGSFAEDDKKALLRIIHEVKRYENKIRELAIGGAADRAVVLVDLLMDEDFVGRKGDEITWRVEQWFYDKKYDAWTTFRTRVLYRYRVSRAAWQTWGWQFEPALGGFNITPDLKEPVTVSFTLPEKPAAEKGLAGSKLPPVKEAPPASTEAGDDNSKPPKD